MASEVFCVKPDSNAHCNCTNFSKCNVLLHYVQNIDSSFASDVVMELMPGTHVLELNGPIRRDRISNFTLTGQEGTALLNSNQQPEPTARIECQGSHQSGFYFVSSSSISIRRLSIDGCGLVFVNKGNTLVRGALALDNVTNLTVTRVSIINSKGFGLHADRVFGEVLVTESFFWNNQGGYHYYGGNVRIWYANCFYYPNYTTTSVTIKSSWFIYGRDYAKPTHNLFYPDATGLTVRVGCPRITVNITNITATHNRADNGGNVAISLNFSRDSHSAVYLSDSLISHGFSHRGGGLRVWSLMPNTSSEYPELQAAVNSSRFPISLRLTNVYFVNNTAAAAGGGLYLSHFETDCSSCPLRSVVVENCVFRGNNVSAFGNGAVMQILKHKLPGIVPITNDFEITFCRCSFDNNVITMDERKVAHGSTVEVVSIDKIIFQNCNFTNNNITALSVRSSNIIFKDQILFDSNRGVNGGALKFCDSSFMFLENNTTVRFVNNSASNAGGAIYAQQRCLESAPACFFQPVVEDYTPLASINHSMRIEFWNNSAQYAGDVLYGGAIDYCFTYKLLMFNSTPSYYQNTQLFDTLFDSSAQVGFSKISSDPYGVCLCDSNGTDANCRRKNVTIGPYYRGEQFIIYAVTVGQREGFAPAPIDAIIINGSSTTNITAVRPPKPSNHCVALTFYIHTINHPVKFNLTAQQANPDSGSFYFAFHPPQITVELRKCPWGFQLNNFYCMCNDDLLQYIDSHNVRCYINTPAVQREGSMWIGFDHTIFGSNEEFVKSCANQTDLNDSCQNIAVSLLCPYDYCKVDETNVSIASVDSQCEFHRRGVLCGACVEGRSVSFGDSSCNTCTFRSLLILPLILFLGLVLVAILSALNLTVTEGTINGLIFYANIIQVNHDIYFPGRKKEKVLKAFSSVISWLNLDLGVRTCFYPGMDTYAKVWFQFLFPVYIWLLVAAIVCLSRKYAFFSRLSGENAVKVLATLFLLSMAKLGRNVIAVFGGIKLNFSHGVVHKVWLPDGNVPYFSGKHIPLFFIAVAFTALLLGYVMVLTFVQWLQKCSWRGMFWVNKLKPLFDAYTGPYKDRFRFWTGFLLIVRTTLFVFYALSNTLNTEAKLIVTAIACCVIIVFGWTFGGVYKKWQLDILEASFIFNIGALSIIRCYIEGLDVRKQQRYSFIAFGASTGVALLTFFSVIVYHVYAYTRARHALKACFKAVLRR